MNAAVESWREELSAQPGLTAEIRRELDAHLQDCMAAFRQRGLGELEAFQMAIQRVGQPKQIGIEFKKAMKTNSQWYLTFTAWALYLVSFFLPSYDTLYGWKCALMQGVFWPGTLQGDFLSIHYQFLLLANLIMLASPFLFTKLSKTARQVQWLHHLTLGASILVWAFVAQLLARQDITGVRVGCLVWAISFAMLYFAALLQLTATRKEIVANHA
jgi:hypothetical protein